MPEKLFADCCACLQLVLVNEVKEWIELGPLIFIDYFCCQQEIIHGGIFDLFCNFPPLLA